MTNQIRHCFGSTHSTSSAKTIIPESLDMKKTLQTLGPFCTMSSVWFCQVVRSASQLLVDRLQMFWSFNVSTCNGISSEPFLHPSETLLNIIEEKQCIFPNVIRSENPQTAVAVGSSSELPSDSVGAAKLACFADGTGKCRTPRQSC